MLLRLRRFFFFYLSFYCHSKRLANQRINNTFNTHVVRTKWRPKVRLYTIRFTGKKFQYVYFSFFVSPLNDSIETDGLERFSRKKKNRYINIRICTRLNNIFPLVRMNR